MSGVIKGLSRAAATSTTISSTHLPNRSNHSSSPSVQIDPILEQISLTITAVSLSPLSGNEVEHHIRTKTDDVITRFLPCVAFLVKCQQELRQGLQLAQRRRASGGMTPRQFHNTYVKPLPKQFERENESIMAPDHLRKARSGLDQLVRDSHAAVPQGCNHVRQTFLGGMHENESWGLRKWLSHHGGAGSICYDLEEIMRHIKALGKDENTTKRLAEKLRPIARQAHERLKKDVPSTYQEQSSGHPHLPFFHRLESCLKQMATYDPEENAVICLEESSDEEEEIKVVSPKSSAPMTATMKRNSKMPELRRSPRLNPTPRRSPRIEQLNEAIKIEKDHDNNKAVLSRRHSLRIRNAVHAPSPKAMVTPKCKRTATPKSTTSSKKTFFDANAPNGGVLPKCLLIVIVVGIIVAASLAIAGGKLVIKW